MNRGLHLRRVGIAVAAIVGVGAIGVQISQAKLTASHFEMADGNLVNDTDPDWETLGQTDPVTRTTCGAGTKMLCSVDLPTGKNDDSFGTGTKEDTAVPTIVKGSIPNNKSDLVRAYASGEVGTDGSNFLYLAWERVQDPSGSTNMDFELNQSRYLSSNNKTPVRTAGDLLVSYDLANGGTVPTLGYRTWLTGGGSAATLCEASTAFPCWSKLVNLGVTKEGAVNTSPVSDPILIGSQTTARTLSARTFGEAALNLTAANILPEDGCITFGSVFLKSRSSDSFTAAVKDFIAPTNVEISNCGSVDITKTDDHEELLGGVEFQLWTAESSTAEFVAADEATVGSPCTTSTVLATLGTCSVLNVPFGQYWLVENSATTPSAYDTAEPTLVTVDLADEGGTAVTIENPRKLGSVTVIKVDDSNADPDLANPVDGATFALYTATDETGFDDSVETAITGATCDTATDAEAGTAGQCVISDLDWGTYWLVETVVPEGYYGADPVLVTIDGTTRDITTDPIVDPIRFKVVTFVCDNQNHLVAGDVAYTVGSTLPSSDTETSLPGTTEEQAAIESAICGVDTGYAYTPRGSVSASATVPTP